MKEVHAFQCSQLNRPDCERVSVKNGINRISSLTLPYFSTIDGMPLDIMQDLYEGVVPHEMKLLVNYCVSKEYLP